MRTEATQLQNLGQTPEPQAPGTAKTRTACRTGNWAAVT